MSPDIFKEIFISTAGNYAWMIFVLFVGLFFKDVLTKFVAGLIFYFGSHYKEDDIVYIHGEKKARIVRIGLTKTTFYFPDTHRKLVINNASLPNLMIEKHLPVNGFRKDDE